MGFGALNRPWLATRNHKSLPPNHHTLNPHDSYDKLVHMKHISNCYVYMHYLCQFILVDWAPLALKKVLLGMLITLLVRAVEVQGFGLIG